MLDVNAYRKRLKEFNSTEKYQQEMDKMITEMNITGRQRILDYGCGTGKMLEDINLRVRNLPALTMGFDVMDGFYKGSPENFITNFNKLESIAFHKIYFMHSIAHIVDVENVVENLRKHVLIKGGEIYVITPNKRCIESIDNKNYIPDPTVYKHYSGDDLLDIFSGFSDVIIQEFGKIINGVPERLFLKAK